MTLKNFCAYTLYYSHKLAHQYQQFLINVKLQTKKKLQIISSTQNKKLKSEEKVNETDQFQPKTSF